METPVAKNTLVPVKDNTAAWEQRRDLSRTPDGLFIPPQARGYPPSAQQAVADYRKYGPGGFIL